jgi:hypothetical protein
VIIHSGFMEFIISTLIDHYRYHVYQCILLIKQYSLNFLLQFLSRVHPR